MRGDLDEVYNRLIMQRYPEKLFADRLSGKKEKHNKGVNVICPFHDDKNPSFDISFEKPVFHCHGCGEKGSWIDYLVKTQNLQVGEAIRVLANEAGISINYENQAEYEKDVRQGVLLEEAIRYFQSILWGQEGQETLEYLIFKRGYSKDEIKKMGLGHFPGLGKTEKYLRSKGFLEDEIKQAFPYKREGYSLVFAYRDHLSHTKSLWTRVTRPLKEDEPENRKYLPVTREASRVCFFNIEHREQGSNELIIVEGYLDALKGMAKGIKNLVACGSANIQENQLDHALKIGIKNFYLALDNDPSGQAGMERAVELIRRKGGNVYIVTWSKDSKDLDELLNKDPQGLDIFLEAKKNAETGIKWVFKGKAEKADLSNDAGRNALINDCFNFDASLPSTRVRDGEDAYKIVAEKTGYSIETLLEERQVALERKKQEKVKKGIRSIVSGLERNLKGLESGSVETVEFLKEASDKIEGLKRKAEGRGIEAKESFIDFLNAKYEREKNRDPNEPLGYRLNKFKTIEKNTDGIQPGLYLVGGESNAGKTAYLNSLCLDLLDSNAQTIGVYISMDDPKSTIVNRLLANITFIDLNKIQKRQATEEGQERLKSGYEKIISLHNTGRFHLLDAEEVKNMDNLEFFLEETVGEDISKVFLCIDGLYDLPLGKSETKMDIREMNIERAQRIKGLSVKYKIPIIATGEVTKRKGGNEGTRDRVLDMHDFMETGKYAYKADVLWTLNIKENDKGLEVSPVTLYYAKNKLHHYKKYQGLEFVRAKSIIREGKKK